MPNAALAVADEKFLLRHGNKPLINSFRRATDSRNFKITDETMSDSFWQSVRYVLIAVGSYFAGKGKTDASQVAPLADQIIQIGGTVVAVVMAAWGAGWNSGPRLSG